MISNTTSGTSITEIADGIFRIHSPVPPSMIPGGFSFNQYLIVDDEPLLFHTGLRRLFPLISEAISRIIPVNTLRYIGFSHVEADECGALNEFLALAPKAQPVCSRVAAMTSVNDIADRAPLVLADNESLSIGAHTLRWFDTPHLPHGWESGLMFEEKSGTLFCGDLFTQPGVGQEAITSEDILEPSEMLRSKMAYFSQSPNSVAMLERLAETEPKLLACMHGSAWQGDGASLLRELAVRLSD